MPSATVTISKFVGSVSLGLLTGLSYTLNTTALPSLLALPTAATCAQSIAILRQNTSFQRTVLTTLSLLPLSIAYIASPRYAKHPYLIWSMLVASIATYGVDPLLATSFISSYLPSDAHAATSSDVHDTTSVGSSGSDDGIEGVRGSWVGVKGAREAEEGKTEEDVNGEVVRARLERWRVTEVVKGSVAGLAFAMSVIGIWGDGY